MELTYEMTREQGLAVHRALVNRLAIVRIFKRTGWLILPLLFFVYFIWQSLPFGNNATIDGKPAPVMDAILTIPFIGFFSLVLGIVAYVLIRAVGRSFIRRRNARVPDGLFGFRRITLDDEGITVAYPVMTVHCKWPMVAGVKDVAGLVIVKAPHTRIMAIPDRAFASTDHRRQFIDAIAAHLQR